MNIFRRSLFWAIPILAGSFVCGGVAGRALAQEASRQTRHIGPFLVQADFDLADVAEELDSLQALCEEITGTLRLSPPGEGVNVRIFADESRWREYYRLHFSGTAYRRALFLRKDFVLDRSGYKGDVFLCRTEFFGDDMRHECTHAFITASLRKSVPIWLDEGLAEYFEITGDRVNNKTWLPKTRERLAAGTFQPLSKLEKLAGMSDMKNEYYGDSWAWVCYMLNGPESVRALLPQYLHDLADRKLFPASVGRRLETTVGKKTIDPLRRFYGLP